MIEQPSRTNQRDHGKLMPVGQAEQREVMRRWIREESGMDGARGDMPTMPDDPVAYKLLDAAGDAMGRGDSQKAINILRLLVKDYRQTREAACARSVIDRIVEKDSGR